MSNEVSYDVWGEEKPHSTKHLLNHDHPSIPCTGVTTYETITFEEFLEVMTQETLHLALVEQNPPYPHVLIKLKQKAECVLWLGLNPLVVNILVVNHAMQEQIRYAIMKLYVRHYDPQEYVMRFNLRKTCSQVGLER